MNNILHLIVVTLIFISLDMVWFSQSADMYKATILNIQKTPLNMRIGSGIFVWILLAAGLKMFVLEPNMSTTNAFIKGAIFGLITYGVFNGTNHAIFENYDLKTSMYDTLWGGFVCGTSAVLATML